MEPGDNSTAECGDAEVLRCGERELREKSECHSGVVDVETFAKAATGRFLAHTVCDPLRAGIGVVDEGIPVKGRLSFGGACWLGSVDVVDLGPSQSSTSSVW